MLLKDWIQTKTRSITPLTEWPLLYRIPPPNFTSRVFPCCWDPVSFLPRSLAQSWGFPGTWARARHRPGTWVRARHRPERGHARARHRPRRALGCCSPDGSALLRLLSQPGHPVRPRCAAFPLTSSHLSQVEYTTVNIWPLCLSYVGVRERRKGNFVDPPPSRKVLGHFEPKFSWTYWWEIVLCMGHNWSFLKKLFGSSDGVNLKILYRYFVAKRKNVFFFFVILSWKRYIF